MACAHEHNHAHVTQSHGMGLIRGSLDFFRFTSSKLTDRDAHAGGLQPLGQGLSS
jgi:hypothetical protein